MIADPIVYATDVFPQHSEHRVSEREPERVREIKREIIN